MAVHLQSFNIPDANPWDKAKQALSDSTNIHLADSHCRSKVSNEKFPGGKSDRLVFDKQVQIEQRAMYNARQTLLIPFIADMDFSSLVESSELQNDLLINILTLLKKSNEECSFFEQFKI